MDQSVLDAGLSVLSLTTGPVLGAFLLGVLTRRVGGGAVLIGMAAGAVVLTILWWTNAVGWTWYTLAGAAITTLVALLATAIVPGTRAAVAPAPAEQ
jgi:Na+/proline symporter